MLELLLPLMAASPSAMAPDVALDALAAGDERAAIERLESNADEHFDDPARLLNLGYAYARVGNDTAARRMFAAVEASDDRTVLETANGEWVDSRHLARRAMKMLAAGQLSRQVQVAAR